jgi:hypothetical protein
MQTIRGDNPVGVVIHICVEISQGNSLCRVEQVLPRRKGWHQWEGGGGRGKREESEYSAKNVYTCMQMQK